MQDMTEITLKHKFSMMEITLKHPFSMMIAGGRKAGKTEFTKRLLTSHLIEPKPERIVWCYAKHQPDLYKQLLANIPSIEYIDGIPTDLENMFDRNQANLIIFDDMMDEVTQDVRIAQLFSRGRHDNLSVIYLTQNLFHKKQRNISLNSDYMVIFKNARDQSQIQHLAKQFMPNNTKFLMDAYRNATQSPFSYLLLDLTPSTEDKYRIRSNVFEEPQYVYIPNKL